LALLLWMCHSAVVDPYYRNYYRRVSARDWLIGTAQMIAWYVIVGAGIAVVFALLAWWAPLR